MAKNNKKQDISIIINIIFLLIFISAIVGFFLIFGKNNFEALKTGIKQSYNDKDKQTISLPIKQESEKKAELPEFKNYKFKYTYDVNIIGHIKNLDVNIYIPFDEKEKQYISDFNMSVKPTKMYNDGASNIAEYHIENIDNQHIVFTYEGKAKLRTYDIKLAKLMNKNFTPEKDLTKYLQPEPYIESNDNMIKNIAKKIKGSTQEEIVQNIYEYTQKNLNYKPIPGTMGAKKALQMKEGKCAEYSAVMVALCRAKNIPARVVIGNIARKQIPQHGWVEVYYDEYGWVTYDPTKQATEVTVLDSKGNVVKKEKRYEVNTNLNYITSGKNAFNPFSMSFSTTPTQNGTARLSEAIEIEEI